MAQPLWHLLQVSDVLDIELASALSESVPLLAWEPQRLLRPSRIRPGTEQERFTCISPETPATPPEPVRVRRLPLLRGFARPPLSWFARTGPAVVERLLSQTSDPVNSPLICTVPFFASVAERWPGPVIYWLTDLIAEYSSADRAQVIQLDRRMCKAATLLCPNSRVLASYLVEHAKADPSLIHITPNATRASNLLPTAPHSLDGFAVDTLPFPPASGPVAGVIGNLAGNMDWLLLERLVQLTPWLTWIFVGPITMEIADGRARRARQALMANPQARFMGKQPYGALAAFARSFDVAILPYRRCEPTYSGSSTRFYEHLAACRPMIATRGLEELNHKTPLLTLVDTAEEAAAALSDLRAKNFHDGLLELRWQVSSQNTWQSRAHSMQQALAERLTLRAPLPICCVT